VKNTYRYFSQQQQQFKKALSQNIKSMKNTTRILILILFVLSTIVLNAQTPPHPNGGKVPGSSGTSNAPVGGGAPIGSGNLFMIVLAVAFAGRKACRLKSEYADGKD
jgi:hypothetical protein